MIESKHVPKPRRSRIGAWALAGILLAGGLWFYRRTGRAQEGAAHSAPAPRVPVTVARARSGNVDVAVNSLGTVTAVSNVTITSRVAGVLDEVRYQEGQTVKRGDLLAVIDPRPYEAAVVQAKGQIARDQALLTNARIDADRYRTAFEKHAIPQQQLATQESIVHQNEGIVQLDQGMLDAAQVNLDYTRITSPIDGRVGLRLVDAGNNVAANGTTGLVTITQLQPITVIFTLSQDNLAAVTQGMRQGSPLRVEAFDRKLQRPIAQGTLLTIDNQVDPATGTIRLKGIFPNQDESLWPGEFVNIRLVTGVALAAVTVPSRSVQNGPNGNYLYVVKPDDSVELRGVDVAQVSADQAVIGRGLAADELVVVDGQYRLEPGSKITVRTAASSGAN